jgi:hypothetical protein
MPRAGLQFQPGIAGFHRHQLKADQLGDRGMRNFTRDHTAQTVEAFR